MKKLKKKSLNIVHTEALTGPGGQTLRVINEACGMIARGHRVTLFCRPGSYLYDQSLARGLPAYPWLAKKPSITTIIRLRRWLENNAVDVINTHSSADSWVVAMAQLGLSRKAPVVRTRHMNRLVPRSPLSAWLFTKATNYIVTTGEMVRQNLIVENGFDGSRIRSIPSGIDHRHFCPGDKTEARKVLGLPQNKTIIGMIAIFSCKKGFDDLIRAAGLLKDRGYKWLLIGDQTRQAGYKDSLEQLVKDEGLSDQIVFPGFQSDVLPWLQSLDLFCFPTFFDEGVPQVILQAMLCRLPIVTTPVGSISDAVEHMKTGLMVEPRNPAALAQMVDTLLKNPALCEELADRGYRKALTLFTQDVMLDAMEEVFLGMTSPSEYAFRENSR